MSGRRPGWALLIVCALVLAACGSSDGDNAAGDGRPAAESSGDVLPDVELERSSGDVLPDVELERSSGDVLPDVEIQRFDGAGTISLADIEGPAVVNLWATWCAPCRREIPDFEAVHQARRDEVRFVGINIGEDADRAAEFLAEVGATYDQFLDSEGYVVTELRTTTMPVTIVLDANGDITKRHLGPLDQDGLDEAIDEALNR